MFVGWKTFSSMHDRCHVEVLIAGERQALRNRKVVSKNSFKIVSAKFQILQQPLIKY
jgi:hypothetical protein